MDVRVSSSPKLLRAVYKEDIPDFDSSTVTILRGRLYVVARRRIFGGRE